MEQFRGILKKRSKDKVAFVVELLNALLSREDVYSNEVLFRDAVEEIHSTLREAVVRDGREELVDAYEYAVILKYVVSGKFQRPEDIMRAMLESLGGSRNVI